MSGSKSVALACLLANILIYASIPNFLKYFTGYIDAWTANGIRYGFSALILLPFVIRHGRDLAGNRGIWRAAVLPAAVNYTGQVAWAWCPYFNDAIVISFVVRSAFLFAMLFGFWILHRERFLLRSPVFGAGAVAIAVGVLFMYRGALQHGGTSLFGILLVLGTAACWGLYSVTVARFLRAYPPHLAFAVICLYTAPGLVVTMFSVGEVGQLGALDRTQWFMLLTSGVLGVTIGHIFMYRIIQSFGPVLLEAGHSLIPVAAMVMAFLYLGERMTGSQWVGGALVIFGSLVAILGPGMGSPGVEDPGTKAA